MAPAPSSIDPGMIVGSLLLAAVLCLSTCFRSPAGPPNSSPLHFSSASEEVNSSSGSSEDFLSSYIEVGYARQLRSC
eukprot:593645-Hanusia_phi.AAC.3